MKDMLLQCMEGRKKRDLKSRDLPFCRSSSSPTRSQCPWNIPYLFEKIEKNFLLAHACAQVHRFSQRNPADSAYLCETDASYDSIDGVSERAASSSPPSSLTHEHRCIGSRNATRKTLPTYVKLTYVSVYDSRDGVSERAASSSPPSSLTHVHRCIGSRNATRKTLSTSAKLTYVSVYDSRDGVSERVVSPSPPSSLTHVHRCIGSRNATRKTLSTSAKLTSLSMYDSRNDTTHCMWVV